MARLSRVQIEREIEELAPPPSPVVELLVRVPEPELAVVSEAVLACGGRVERVSQVREARP